MTLIDAFERIHIINLPERTDRWRDTLRELGKIGVGPEHPRLRKFAAIRPDTAGLFPSRGAHGCFMSHLGVIRQALHDRLANLLIVEDDIALTPAVALPHAAMIDRINRGDWDFAYPGHVETLDPAGETPQWHSTTAPLVCAHFYALNQRILPRLVDYLDACQRRPPGHPDGGPMHVDGAYSMFRQRNPDVLTLIATHSFAAQRSSRSDIYPNRWYDRAPLTRQLAAIARHTRNRWREHASANSPKV